MKRFLISLMMLTVLLGTVATVSADDNSGGISAASALRSIRNLAEEGDAPFQWMLGLEYADQTLLGLDYAEGHIATKDNVEAVKWFRKSADQGFARAQYKLAMAHAHGSGVEQDFGETVKWFRKAAEQGYVKAQGSMGVIYNRGELVTQDYAKALSWFRKSAEQGDAGTQSELGAMYLDGRGVTQDFISAHMWFNIASANGYSFAAKRRDDVADLMSSDDISQSQRRAKLCMESNYQDCD